MQCALGPLVSIDFRTQCFCRPEGLAFTAVSIFHLVDLPSLIVGICP